jgi:hypothetical protein
MICAKSSPKLLPASTRAPAAGPAAGLVVGLFDALGAGGI